MKTTSRDDRLPPATRLLAREETRESVHVGGFFGETSWWLDERREKRSRWKNTMNREKTKRKKLVAVGHVGLANHCLHSFYFRKRCKNEKKKEKQRKMLLKFSVKTQLIKIMESHGRTRVTSQGFLSSDDLHSATVKVDNGHVGHKWNKEVQHYICDFYLLYVNLLHRRNSRAKIVFIREVIYLSSCNKIDFLFATAGCERNSRETRVRGFSSDSLQFTDFVIDRSSHRCQLLFIESIDDARNYLCKISTSSFIAATFPRNLRCAKTYAKKKKKTETKRGRGCKDRRGTMLFVANYATSSPPQRQIRTRSRESRYANIERSFFV
ncbi:hypothetical protein E2986_11909 [Frieseomelitta varia]|uniref:Uncharacterized protein n=1 Tax=Frieseomelitta varia TaxID=561572 RepID=A0A833RYT5_9HYME|nr:hypothetical protein E2986_11909 [Frieseomelitta varia]